MKPEGWAFIYWLRPLAVLLILLASPVHGQSLQDQLFGVDNEGGVERYQIRDITRSQTGGFTDEFQFLKLHTREVGPGGVILRINVQATYAIILANDGKWHYQLEVDGLPVEDCEFDLPTVNPGGFLAGDLPVYPSYDVECTVPPTVTSGWTEGQTVPLTWNRTVLSGTPDEPESSTISIVIDRADLVIMSSPTAFEQLTGVTGLEFALFVAVIGLGVLFWSRSKDPVVQLFSALLVVLFGAIGILLHGEWVGWVPIGASMVVLGAYFILRSTLDALTEG